MNKTTNTQMRTLKVYLIPTKEQELQFNKSAGVSRWAYNYSLALNKQCYEQLQRYMTEQDIRKTITQLKQDPNYQWLKEVNNNVYKQAVKDQDKAFKAFFQGRARFPRFKKKNKTKDSFYIDSTHSFRFTSNGTKVQLPSIGEVKISRSFYKFKLQNTNNLKLYNTHIVKDQLNRWYITITLEFQKRSMETSTSLMIKISLKTKRLKSNKTLNKRLRKKSLNPKTSSQT